MNCEQKKQRCIYHYSCLTYYVEKAMKEANSMQKSK